MRRSLLIAIAIVLGIFGNVSACVQATAPGNVELYPSAGQLPENLLRLYLYFPRRMGPYVSSSDLKLFDGNGDEVAEALLPTRYELWSPDRSRLTVLLNPGRVKTGLSAHEALGRALVAGQRYTLVVPGALADARGCRLGEDIKFTFSAGPPDLERPSPANWIVGTPQVATTNPLSVDLLSMHDHLSMAYRLRVIRADGEVVAGKIDVLANEQIWQFTPTEPWAEAAYSITIDDRLEDVAGNRPGMLFDQPTDAPEVDWIRELAFVPQGPDKG